MAALSATCIFCKIIRQEIPCHKLLETDKVLAFLDINPIAPGHSLVIPKFHGEKLHDVPVDYLVDVAPTLRKVAVAMGLDNYNVLQNNGALAHQEVPHVHFHLIPKPNSELGLGLRWKPLPTNHAEFAKLAEEVRNKL